MSKRLPAVTLRAKSVPMVAAFVLCFPIHSVANFQIPSKPGVPQERLSEILKRTSEYCKRLDNAAFDFVCLEEINEDINLARDIQKYLAQLAENASPEASSSFPNIRVPKEKVHREFVYDYQVIRKENKTTETRILLEENGKKRYEKDAKLKTANFRFQNVLFAPLGFLGERLQFLYEYTITDETTLDGQPVWVLEAKPLAGLKTPFLFGNFWVRQRDYAILKIRWNQEGVGNFSVFERRADQYHAQPRITLTSEFSTEKNGINFPSKFYIEEGYVLENGKTFIRSQTTVTYRDFKFFSVEVSTEQ
jgi:hypothetical protein